MFCSGSKTIRLRRHFESCFARWRLACIASLKRYDIERERVFDPAESFSAFYVILILFKKLFEILSQHSEHALEDLLIDSHTLSPLYIQDLPYLLQLRIISQILSTSASGRSAYSGRVSTLLLRCRATGVSSTSYLPWKQSKVFVIG